jgi:hypothetical protein
MNVLTMNKKIATVLFSFGLIGGVINACLSESFEEMLAWSTSASYAGACLLLVYAPSNRD